MLLSWSLLFCVSFVSAYFLCFLLVNVACRLRWIYPLYISIHIALPIMSVSICLFVSLSVLGRIILLLEQVRLAIKFHSVFRTIMGFKLGQGAFVKRISVTDPYSMQQLLYFYFAPVLIYQSSYFVSSGVKKRGLLKLLYRSVFHIINIFVSTYILLFIFHQVIGPYFDKLIITSVGDSFRSNTPIFDNFEFLKQSLGLFFCLGTPIFLLCFFLFFESWMNLWAEMLSFEDRSFYEDWWNSCSFSQFYRKWNCIVHDFLYAYLYGDFIRYFRATSIIDPSSIQTTSILLVFNISAIVHEFVISFSLGFFYPVLFALFSGPGVVLYACFRKTGYDWRLNAIFWLFMFMGLGITIFLYSFEYFCRRLLCDYIIHAHQSTPLVSHL